MTTLARVKACQPDWFSGENKRFFGDVSYRVLHGKETGKPYLVRETSAWTDMLGGMKKFHFRVNHLADDLKIESLVDTYFQDLDEVKRWLEDN